MDLNAHKVAKFDLTLSLSDSGAEGIVGALQYADDLFEVETIERWSGYFSRLVAECVNHLDTPLHGLDMFSETERQHLLVELNQTHVSYPETALIHGLFEQQVKANPNAIAVVYEDESLTYQALNHRANQLAHYLIEQGVTPDTLVGLCLERSLEMVIGLLGILKAGGAYVPLDPTYPEARLAYQIDDAKLDIVITNESSKNVLSSLNIMSKACPVSLDDSVITRRLEGYSKRNPGIKKHGLTSDHLAYVIYTSGTTGNPKGVMVEHKGVVNYANAVDAHCFLDTLGGVVSGAFNFDLTVTTLLPPLVLGKYVHLAQAGELDEVLTSVYEILRCSNEALTFS